MVVVVVVDLPVQAIKVSVGRGRSVSSEIGS
jgi:hypothetical protein